MKMTGGLGNIAHGRHQYGAAASDVEPRFYVSDPSDGAHNVSLEKWIEFEVYYFSSFPDEFSPEILALPVPFEISEDGGATYEFANVAPYSVIWRYKDGQTLWVKIRKAAPWATQAEVVIRSTYPDEFGQAVTKVVPVTWE